jgi:hypothetical protein
MNILKTNLLLLSMAAMATGSCYANKPTARFGDHFVAMYNGVVPAYVPYGFFLATVATGSSLGLLCDEHITQFNKNIQNAPMVKDTPLKDYVPNVPACATVLSTGASTLLGGYLTYKLRRNTPEQLVNRAEQLIAELKLSAITNKKANAHNRAEIIGSIGSHFAGFNAVTILKEYQDQVAYLIKKLTITKDYVESRNQELFNKIMVGVPGKVGLLAELVERKAILDHNSGDIQITDMYTKHASASQGDAKLGIAKSREKRDWMKFGFDVTFGTVNTGLKVAKYIGTGAFSTGWKVTKAVAGALVN